MAPHARSPVVCLLCCRRCRHSVCPQGCESILSDYGIVKYSLDAATAAAVDPNYVGDVVTYPPTGVLYKLHTDYWLSGVGEPLNAVMMASVGGDADMAH